jgi:hypothetical protein
MMIVKIQDVENERGDMRGLTHPPSRNILSTKKVYFACCKDVRIILDYAEMQDAGLRG